MPPHTKQNSGYDYFITKEEKKILLPCFTTWVLIEADILFLYFSAKYTSSYCLSVPDATSWQERAHLQRNWARSWDAFWNGCTVMEHRIFYPKTSKYASKCSKQPQNFQGVFWILRVLWVWGFSSLLFHLPPVWFLKAEEGGMQISERKHYQKESLKLLSFYIQISAYKKEVVFF